MARKNRVTLAALLMAHVTFFPAAAQADGESASLSSGTRLYLTLDKAVSSKRGESEVGEVLPCRVWRDVESGGVVFIKSGTPATCRIDKVKRSNMGGIEGKVSIAGVETKSVDGQLVMLSGGYNKEGSGRKAAVWTVGLLLLWPVLFVPGGAAELAPGTVFDVSIVNDLRVATAKDGNAPARVNLASLGTGFSAEFMLDDLLAQAKPEIFRIKVQKDGALPEKLFIDNVNGKPIDPALPLEVKEVKLEGDVAVGVAEIRAKTIAKHFAKGINRFEVAYAEGGERTAQEVILDVQM
jgi:hypothetical protein